MKCDLTYKYLDGDVEQYWIYLFFESDVSNCAAEKVFKHDCCFDDKDFETDLYSLPVLAQKMFNPDLLELYKDVFERIGSDKKDLESFSVTINESVFNTDIPMNNGIQTQLILIKKWMIEEFEVFKSEATEE